MVYKHSKTFLKRKIKKLDKEIIKLEQERTKTVKQYFKYYEKDDIELIREKLQQEE